FVLGEAVCDLDVGQTHQTDGDRSPASTPLFEDEDVALIPLAQQRGPRDREGPTLLADDDRDVDRRVGGKRQAGVGGLARHLPHLTSPRLRDAPGGGEDFPFPAAGAPPPPPPPPRPRPPRAARRPRPP